MNPNVKRHIFFSARKFVTIKYWNIPTTRAVGVAEKTKKNNILKCHEITLFKLTNVNLIVNFNLPVSKGYITHEIYSLLIGLVNLNIKE